MTTRRDFLKSLGTALGAIAVVPASALAQVQRLGTVPEWVKPPTFAVSVTNWDALLREVYTADVLASYATITPWASPFRGRRIPRRLIR